MDRAEAALDWHVAHMQEAILKVDLDPSFGSMLAVSMPVSDNSGTSRPSYRSRTLLGCFVPLMWRVLSGAIHHWPFDTQPDVLCSLLLLTRALLMTRHRIRRLSVWTGFLVAGKSAQGFNVLQDLCGTYDNIGTWYKGMTHGVTVFGEKGSEEGPLFNIDCCILHVKAVWLLMCPTGDIDPDTAFHDFNFSAQEYCEMNLMSGSMSHDGCRYSQLFFMGCVLPVWISLASLTTLSHPPYRRICSRARMGCSVSHRGGTKQSTSGLSMRQLAACCLLPTAYAANVRSSDNDVIAFEGLREVWETRKGNGICDEICM